MSMAPMLRALQGRSFSRAEFAWRASAAIAIAVGVIVLFGWIADIEWIGGLLGTVRMKANTALSFVLLGTALALLGPERIGPPRKVTGGACAGLAALVGLASLSEWVFGWDLRIDQLLFTEPPGAAGTSEPGRMASTTAISFILGGTAICLLRARAATPAQALSLVTGLLAALAMADVLFDGESLKGIGRQTQMAVPTSFTFLVLSAGMLSARYGGLMAEVRSRNAGGTAARFLIPVAVLAPMALGWLALLGQDLGLYSETREHALLATADIGVIAGLVWLAARSINRLDAEAGRQRAHFAAIVGSASDAITMRSLDGSITAWNEAAGRLFGYTAAEVMGRRDLFLAPGELQGEVAQELADLRDGTPVQGIETVRVAKDGRHIAVSVSRFQVRDAAGALMGTGSLFRDITERKRADEALRESEERFRATFEQAAVGISHVAPDGRWLRVNQKLCDMLGYTREELLQTSFREITYQEDLAATVEAGQPLVEGEAAMYSLEKRYIRKDGSPVWVDRTVSLVRTASGEPDYFIFVTEDITERKQAEEALRESEERTRAILESAPEAVISMDSQGCAVEWNSEAARIFAWSREEARGKPVADLIIPPVSRDAHRQGLKLFLETGEGPLLGTLVEVDAMRSDGSEFPVELSLAVMRRQGAPLFVAFLRDITGRRRAEAEREQLELQLRQSQKMDAVGQLAAGVAHDFNNKLAVILGSADLAMAALAPADEIRTDIEEIRTAAWRSADLTRQLLAFARLQPIAPKQLDLNDTVASTLKMLGRLTGEGVALVWNPDAQPCWVRMDPGQADQVLVNLVINARDAISGSGAIRITTRNADFDVAYCANHADVVPGRYVVLEVSDDGCGMDAETRERIFEPFFTTKPQGQGTGLGLATVHGIAHQNHGFVDVESELGRGSAITVYLPRESGQPGGSTAPTGTRAGGGSETVLLVEDEPALLKLAARMLEQLGFAVLASATPGEAIQRAAAHEGQIHLLVSDVIMPEMNGAELQRRLQAIRPQLRCLFVSGYPAKVLAESGVLDPDVDLLPKPYSQEALALKLREVLDRR